MEDNEIMLDVVCYSEKEKVRLGFGFCISEEDKERKTISDSDEIEIGIGESYYELYSEFEPGINKARELIKDRRCSSIDDALREVFGHFKLSFSIDGIDEDFDCDFDVDKCVFDVIKASNDFEKK